MKSGAMRLAFNLLGGMLLLFILLPLVAMLFSIPISSLLDSFLDAEVSSSIGLTLGASALATTLAIFTGLPLAYVLARSRFRGKRLVESLVDLPVVIPHTAAGIALLLVFGSQGWLGRAFAPVGIHFVDTLAGVSVAMAFVSLPYLVNLAREAFASVDIELEQAAAVDGASPFQAFCWVTLPVAWRGVLSGILMMWARGISEFGAVIILAYHPRVVPVLVYERFQGFGLAAAQPVAVLLVLVVLAVFITLRMLLYWKNE
jgi:molybdate/tungstate transport system permease protein